MQILTIRILNGLNIIRVFRIPFEWLQFAMYIRLVRIPFEWLEFPFEWFEYHSNDSNWHSTG